LRPYRDGSPWSGGASELPSGVRCRVEECVHNRNGACRASAIEVRSSGDEKVATQDGTCCGTFEVRK
jgi:hypothetical protein